MDLEQYAQLATAIGGAIALLTLAVGVVEYARQGAQKRADYFHTMRRLFKSNDNLLRLCELLESDDPELEELSFKDKRELLGFF